MNDLPVFPDASEWMALWPMWLVLMMFIFVWQWSGFMDRQMTRWNRMHRMQEIQAEEAERQRTMLLK